VALADNGDLDAAAAQVCRFLALDVDGRGWPQVGRRDPAIADAQARLPGLRPCGFHSPYEAAAWSVLAQRQRIVQTAWLRAERITRHGQDGAFPPPHVLARADLDLPGRKGEYLRAVAGTALDGLLYGAALRALDPGQAVQRVEQVRGSSSAPHTLCAGWRVRSWSSGRPCSGASARFRIRARSPGVSCAELARRPGGHGFRPGGLGGAGPDYP
jgi:hypothetical protein